MNCEKIRRYLDAAIDQELETGLMLEVDNHLAQCQDCTAVARVKTDLKNELRTRSRIAAPPHLRSKIITAADRRRRTKRIAVLAGPIAAAAALLITFKLSTDAPPQEPLSAVVEDVVERHVRELPLEIEGPDTRRAASWFRGKVDFPVRAPAIHLQKASFQGARLSHVRSHQAAHMVYMVDGHRVTLMIFNPHTTMFTGNKRVRVGNRDVLLDRKNGYNVAVFLDGDMAYALSSDLPESRLLKLISAFRPANL